MIWSVCCVTTVYCLQRFGKMQTEDKVDTNCEEVRIVLSNPLALEMDI